MARIRTVKPEFWTSEQVVECSVAARLLFIGLWNFCDDRGVHPASPRQLRMKVFPGDDSMTIEVIAGLVAELLQASLIAEYEAEGRSWWQVTGWHHQKISKPQPSCRPVRPADPSPPATEPPEPRRSLPEPIPGPFREHSGNTPEPFPDRSGNVPEPLPECSAEVVGALPNHSRTTPGTFHADRREGKEGEDRKGGNVCNARAGPLALGENTHTSEIGPDLVGAYCRGMGYEPDALTTEYGMFHLIDRLSSLAGGSVEEVLEVAGYYRAEAAG